METDDYTNIALYTFGLILLFLGTFMMFGLQTPNENMMYLSKNIIGGLLFIIGGWIYLKCLWS